MNRKLNKKDISSEVKYQPIERKNNCTTRVNIFKFYESNLLANDFYTKNTFNEIFI